MFFRKYRKIIHQLLLLLWFIILIIFFERIWFMHLGLENYLLPLQKIKGQPQNNINNNIKATPPTLLERMIQQQQQPLRSESPGALGRPYTLKNISQKEAKLIQIGWNTHMFNQYVSDLISTHRSLPDIRDDWCKQPGRFLKNLPATSVIICFHNEAWSTLLRTVHSVIERSPMHLLKEIILVDDASQHGNKFNIFVSSYQSSSRQTKDNSSPCSSFQGQTHQSYEEASHCKDHSHPPTWVGLIKARLAGLQASTAEVATFLDSHCECTPGYICIKFIF